MNAYEQIGKKIQTAREEAGMSQEELAKKIGCTQASLSNYELGKRRLYLADLQRIGQLLGKQVTYFVEDSENEDLDDNDLKKILSEAHLKEILFGARDLNVKQRQSVLEYIQWKKDRGNKA